MSDEKPRKPMTPVHHPRRGDASWTYPPNAPPSAEPDVLAEWPDSQHLIYHWTNGDDCVCGHSTQAANILRCYNALVALLVEWEREPSDFAHGRLFAQEARRRLVQISPTTSLTTEQKECDHHWTDFGVCVRCGIRERDYENAIGMIPPSAEPDVLAEVDTTDVQAEYREWLRVSFEAKGTAAETAEGEADLRRRFIDLARRYNALVALLVEIEKAAERLPPNAYNLARLNVVAGCRARLAQIREGA